MAILPLAFAVIPAGLRPPIPPIYVQVLFSGISSPTKKGAQTATQKKNDTFFRESSFIVTNHDF